MSMRESIFKAALANALKFKGKANPKALIGAVVKDYPEAKNDMKSLMTQINEIVAEVNALSLDAQQQKLLELDPEFEQKQQAQKQARKQAANQLPPLPNAEDGKVVTRIPPEPSKYAHMGHAMSFLINYLYAQQYNGKCILRFDDTNPEKESQEYVDSIKDDLLNYLEIKPEDIVFASDHMDKYLAYAEQLIEKNQAYTCNCTDVSEKRKAMQDCEHRSQSTEETKKVWEQMKSGQAGFVLRLKIDMQHKNAVMRDPVIYRVITSEHYKQGDKYKVWPMYDFETAIEEGLQGITHVLRSNEFDQRIELHNHIASLFNFPQVTYKHYGRYNVSGATTKGREIRELIESGEYLGWDDPRLVTLQALKRRGILKEAFYTLAQQIGLSKTQTNLDFGVIAKVNRTLLDEKARRFFAVQNPITISVNNIPDDIKEFSTSFHPHGEKGERKLSCTKEYYIETLDHDVPDGTLLRLIDGMNIKKIHETTYEFVSKDHDPSLKAKLIHYVPKDGSEIKAEMLMEDTSTTSLILEANASQINDGEVIQFERKCFARLDDKNQMKFWFSHE